jgi:hypothetical protein
MAQGKGGVYGGFVMVALKGGTSQRYSLKAKEGQKALPPAGGVSAGGASSKSNLVMVKEPIAKFFGFEIAVPMDVVRSSLKDVATKINGNPVTRKVMVNQGATGAGRSLTIKFKKLEKIGGKEVASVKMAIPSSHTFGDMVQVLMTRTNASSIAAIVSPSGRTMTFQTAYNSKRKKVAGAKG